ncbi:MAG: hypothetical protein ACK559_35370, partial [bacterium]
AGRSAARWCGGQSGLRRPLRGRPGAPVRATGRARRRAARRERETPRRDALDGEQHHAQRQRQRRQFGGAFAERRDGDDQHGHAELDERVEPRHAAPSNRQPILARSAAPGGGASGKLPASASRRMTDGGASARTHPASIT